MAISLIIIIAVLFMIAFVILLWPLLSKDSGPSSPQKTVHFGEDRDARDLESPDPEYLKRRPGPDAGYSKSDRDPGGSDDAYRH